MLTNTNLTDDQRELYGIYLESKGGHDMTFWNEYAIKFGEMMFG